MRSMTRVRSRRKKMKSKSSERGKVRRDVRSGER